MSIYEWHYFVLLDFLFVMGLLSTSFSLFRWITLDFKICHILVDESMSEFLEVDKACVPTRFESIT